MKHWLFLPPPLSDGTEHNLDARRSHYLTRVLRLRRGERFVCFDGLGTAWAASLETVTAKTTVIRLHTPVERRLPPEAPLHLAQGMLKGAAMDQVMQKATELGATDLWPISADRTQRAQGSDRLERKLEHWRRVVESAAEQCRQLHLPRVHDPLDLAAFLDKVAGTRLLMLDPGSPPLPADIPLTPLALLIGPEGGWSDPERQLAASRGAELHGLGQLILRAETAPLAVLAAVRHARGWR